MNPYAFLLLPRSGLFHLFVLSSSRIVNTSLSRRRSQHRTAYGPINGKCPGLSRGAACCAFPIGKLSMEKLVLLAMDIVTDDLPLDDETPCPSCQGQGKRVLRCSYCHGGKTPECRYCEGRKVIV